jgi:zeaxanthin glucosyltransferase
MSRIGLFPFLGRGHLNPLAALGRKLVAQGHSVVTFHLLMAYAAIKRAGLEFCRIDNNDSPATVYTPTSRNHGPRWLGTRDVVFSQIERVLREAPKAIESNKIEFMLVDQSDLAAGTVAEALGIPFVSISCAPPLLLNSDVPLSYFDWGGSLSIVSRAKTFASNVFVRNVTASLIKKINQYRHSVHLDTLTDLNDTLSKTAIITQIPRSFDFPRRHLPPHFFYTGPFRDAREDCVIKFPWSLLTGKPVIFASLGTVHNNNPHAFRIMADACKELDVQLVISLGGGALLPEGLTDLPGNPLVVEFAPQRELMKHAILVINCAGLNTTFDAMAAGIPIVAVPIAEDQPGVAARIQRAGIGRVVPFKNLTTATLRGAVKEVLGNPRYREKALEFQQQFAQIDGVDAAADIVQKCIQKHARS